MGPYWPTTSSLGCGLRVRTRLIPASMAAYMQADGLHPNPEGVKLIVEGLGPKVEELLAKIGP